MIDPFFDRALFLSSQPAATRLNMLYSVCKNYCFCYTNVDILLNLLRDIIAVMIGHTFSIQVKLPVQSTTPPPPKCEDFLTIFAPCAT